MTSSTPPVEKSVAPKPCDTVYPRLCVDRRRGLGVGPQAAIVQTDPQPWRSSVRFPYAECIGLDCLGLARTAIAARLHPFAPARPTPARLLLGENIRPRYLDGAK